MVAVVLTYDFCVRRLRWCQRRSHHAVLVSVVNKLLSIVYGFEVRATCMRCNRLQYIDGQLFTFSLAPPLRDSRAAQGGPVPGRQLEVWRADEVPGGQQKEQKHTCDSRQTELCNNMINDI